MAHQRTLRTAVGFILLAIACAWPYFATLHFRPMTGDPALWIGRASSLNPDWMDWVLRSSHFSWYRPCAALTFTLNHAIGGLDPWVYRVTDLSLHLFCGYLVLRLARALVPDKPAWLPLLAAALFLAHPGSEDVVPYMARRSYSLATAFGLTALCITAARTERTVRRTLVAGLCLAAALLTNEAAIVFTPIALCLLGQAVGGRALVQRAGLLALPVLAALVLRTAVLDGMGGYGDAVATGTDPTADLVSVWTALSGLGWIASSENAALRSAAPPVLGLTALYLLFRTLRPAPMAKVERGPSVAVTLVLWLAGYAALILTSGLWVERQVYFLQAPFALLLALLIAATLERWPSRPLASALSLVPLAIVAGSLVITSPVLRGQNATRMASWRARQGLLTGIEADLARIEGPAIVHMVMPNMRRRFRTQSSAGQEFVHQSLRHPLLWTQVLGIERDVQASDWVYYDRSQKVPSLLPEVEGRPERILEFTSGSDYLIRTDDDPHPALDWVVWTPGFRMARAGATNAPAVRDLAHPSGRSRYVYIASVEGGHLHRLDD